MFTVETLVGRFEDDVAAGGGQEPERGGYTYVALNRVENWFDAPDSLVARIPGGPGVSGNSSGWQIDISVGETLGLLIGKATDASRGYPFLGPQGTFNQRPDGGYSNGELFVDSVVGVSDLGAMVRALAQHRDEPCPRL